MNREPMTTQLHSTASVLAECDALLATVDVDAVAPIIAARMLLDAAALHEAARRLRRDLKDLPSKGPAPTMFGG